MTSSTTTHLGPSRAFKPLVPGATCLFCHSCKFNATIPNIAMNQLSEKRDPNNLDAWILGSGIASLTAAVHLIQEASVPPSRIHILERLEFAGGDSVTSGDSVNGYHYQAGSMPSLNDSCMERLFSLVPSKTDPNKTVLDEMIEFNHSQPPGKPPNTRFLVRKPSCMERQNGKNIGLGLRDHMDLVTLGFKSEKSLSRSRISDYFHKGFFESKYWLLLATTYVSLIDGRIYQSLN